MLTDQHPPKLSDSFSYHLAQKPNIDSGLLAIILAILVQEDWVDQKWIEKHTIVGSNIYPLLFDIAINKCCKLLRVDESDLKDVAKALIDGWHVVTLDRLEAKLNPSAC